MKRFKFTCGDINEFWVETEQVKDVFQIAINANPDAKQLGMYYMIEEEGKQDGLPYFGHTISELVRLGELGVDEALKMQAALARNIMPIQDDEDDVLDAKVIC
jgi:hypothetical protein